MPTKCSLGGIELELTAASELLSFNFIIYMHGITVSLKNLVDESIYLLNFLIC